MKTQLPCILFGIFILTLSFHARSEDGYREIQLKSDAPNEIRFDELNIRIIIQKDPYGQPFSLVTGTDGKSYNYITKVMNDYISDHTYSCPSPGSFFGNFKDSKECETEGFIPLSIQVMSENQVFKRSTNKTLAIILFGESQHGLSKKMIKTAFFIPLERWKSFSKKPGWVNSLEPRDLIEQGEYELTDAMRIKVAGLKKNNSPE